VPIKAERIELWLASDCKPTEYDAIFLGLGMSKQDAQDYLSELEDDGEVEPETYVPIVTDVNQNEIDWFRSDVAAPYAYAVKL